MCMRFRICGAVVACLAVMLIASSLSAEELTLSQAVEMAISSNPTVAAGRLSAEAARESAKGAGSLANPEIVVAQSVIGDAGSDAALFVSQPLEINGSRRVRGEIASNEAAATGFDAESAKRDIVLSVTLSYWEVARAQELVKLSQENVAYLEAVQTAVRKQYDVGVAPGAQPLKMDVEIARARQEHAQAQLALSLASSELNSLLGRPADTGFSVLESLVFSETPIDSNTLAASALANRPEIASAQAQLRASRGQISAARLLTAPDLAIQARRGSFDRDSEGGVAVVLSLPILDWGSAGAEKRRAQIAAESKEKELEAVRNGVKLDVEQAIQRVNTASRIVREYQGGVLAKSEELAAMACKGYEKGASSYLEVLEAQRTLRSVRSDYYSAMSEHAKAISQLEWAAGCSIPRTEVRK